MNSLSSKIVRRHLKIPDFFWKQLKDSKAWFFPMIFSSTTPWLLGCPRKLGSMVRLVWMGCNLLINGVYWGYNPVNNHLLTCSGDMDMDTLFLRSFFCCKESYTWNLSNYNRELMKLYSVQYTMILFIHILGGSKWMARHVIVVFLNALHQKNMCIVWVCP